MKIGRGGEIISRKQEKQEGGEYEKKRQQNKVDSVSRWNSKTEEEQG